MFLRKFCLIPTILFVFCGLVLGTPNVEAQTVHALVVVMNKDKDIGKGMEVNLDKINEFLDEKVGSQYQVRKTIFRSTAGQTTPDAVLQWIRNLRPAADDVVFFYYGGHGGMVSKTNQRTYLYLTDGKLYRDKIEEVMQNVSCRLKLIITDCCSSYPASAASDTAAMGLTTYGDVVERNYITDLFGKHEGLLHVNGTTEGSYGWVNKNRGGFFTTSLIQSIHHRTDRNRDGFLEWHEVLQVAEAVTQETFNSNYPFFHDKYKRDPQTKLQTPKVYSTPIPVHWDRRDSPDDRDIASGLWELENRSSDIRLVLKPSKRDYRLRDYLTIRLEADRDCYITLFNWEADGTFKQLFPNKYDTDNFIRAGSTLDFPTRNSNFDIRLSGPEGIERLKLVAVRSKAVSDRINSVLSSSGGAFANAKAGDGNFKRMADIEKRVSKEGKIAEILRDIDERDWAIDNTTIDLRR